MARWLTPRRVLVYSAYFTGAFSLLIGAFISRHLWDVHTTIRIMEKSWDVRGHDYGNLTWIDKAIQAVFAGHEDVSEYNDMFWAKFGELDKAEDGHGSFNRSNLTTCQRGYEPEWVDQNSRYEKWGFVLYRTDYEEDNVTWAESVKHINYTIRTHLEIDATHHGSDCDPDLVRDRAVLEIIEDREALEGASPHQIRALWRERVDAGLVDSTFKIGGWDYGGFFRINLPASDDNCESDGSKCKKANGMALNLCFMYDSGTRVMMQLVRNHLPATGPRDAWEPFLLAIDGLWNHERYMYRTSWAHMYPGVYGVALSILFNDFHGRTFEREMERQAPHMYMGGPLVDLTAPWWQRFFEGILSTMWAVARPGHFPFNDRWQEIEYPFVREDSHWKDPAKPEEDTPQVAENVTNSTEWSDFNLTEWLKPRDPLFYLPCLPSDENQEGCFQMGNFRVRKPRASNTSRATDEAVPTSDVKQDAPAEHESS
ncbi:unnamed protein product [Periconia digitata]|uniref:Uncharacterized protein n=1 Tax=Periconia digitata TaxID=1303443 RepID=A0A9W4U6V6_9PLEO|nr:unnamed protein product [Periconia digitata]